MGADLELLDIIFFAMIAGFLFLRLRNVLGRRTGNENQRRDMSIGDEKRSGDNVIAMPDRQPNGNMTADAPKTVKIDESSPAARGLAAIQKADRSFNVATFLNGAGAAYEMIVTAFARNDRETLRSFLNDDVYRDFESAITAREQAEQEMETTVTDMQSVDVVEAGMKDRDAEVTVKFVANIITALRDKEGEIVGEQPRERTVTDLWTFSRNTSSNNPNWTLIETSTEN